MLELTGRVVAPLDVHDEVPAGSLRSWRAERLLSIRDLARLAGVSPSTVYLTEAGRTVPRFAAMRAMVAALGVTAHEVVEFRRAIGARAAPGR